MSSNLVAAERRPEGKKLRQYLAAISASISALTVGTVLGWTSPVFPVILNSALFYPRITDEEGSWISSVIALGAVVGTLPASYCADVFGRKRAISFLIVPIMMSWGLIMFAKSVTYFYIARTFAGIYVGGVSSTVPMYIGEIAETSIRGKLGTLTQWMVTVGILMVYLTGSYLQYMALNIFCSMTSVAFYILFNILAPETPTYLVRTNQIEEAKRSLRILRGDKYDIDRELQEIIDQINKERKCERSFVELFSDPTVYKPTIIIMGLLSFLSLSGMNAIISYAEDIFSAGGSSVKPEHATAIFGGAQVIVTFISGVIVDRVGRRVLLIVSEVVMTICLFALGCYFYLKENNINVEPVDWIPLISLTTYICAFALGIGPVTSVMMGELFAPEVKGIALGVVCIIASFLEFSVVKGYFYLKSTFQYGITFWIFSAFCLAGTIFAYSVVPETKNKTLQEIQEGFMNKKRKHISIDELTMTTITSSVM